MTVMSFRNLINFLALALAAGLLIACFGLAKKKDPKAIPPAAVENCEELEGEAKEECEARKSSQKQ